MKNDKYESESDSDTTLNLSPPKLIPLSKLNNDLCEGTFEDPPPNLHQPGKVNLNVIHQGKPANKDIMFLFLNLLFYYPDDEDMRMSSFADLDVIKMDYIGSVADILGPDPSMQEDSIPMDEQPESSIWEEMDVNGRSFASLEEMNDYVVREESGNRLMKTNDVTQMKSRKNKLQQLAPSLSSFPCPSSTTSSLIPQSEMPTSNDSECASTSAVFSDSCDVPSTSMDTNEKESPNEEEMKKKITLTNQEEASKLGSENIISAEFAKYAISAVFVPSLERKAMKKLDVMPKESKGIPSRGTSSISQRRRRISKQVPTDVPNTTNEIELTEIVNSDEDIVAYEKEYNQKCRKLIRQFYL